MTFALGLGIMGFLMLYTGFKNVSFANAISGNLTPDKSSAGQLSSAVLGSGTSTPDSADLGNGGAGIFRKKNLGRVDMGVDFTGKGVIPAIADAVVTRSSPQGSGTGWPGAGDKGRGNKGAIVVYRITSGPAKGHHVYVAENFDPKVKRGQRIHAGETIGVARGAFPYVETGWAANEHGTTLAAATSGYREGQQTPAGSNFLDFLRHIYSL